MWPLDRGLKTSVFVVIMSAVEIVFGLLDIDYLVLWNLLSMINLFHTYSSDIIYETHENKNIEQSKKTIKTDVLIGHIFLSILHD